MAASQARPEEEGPLAGVTVIEIGAFMAAPFATMQLADLGADVLKIERPETGDPVRQSGPFVEGESSPFIRLNRNKRSVAVDLKAAEGKAVIERLVADADVLVENLRPGTMRRLGLGYDDLLAINPGLVYVSVSGWGQDGPLADLAGLDIMAQARGGLMSITGAPDGEPAKVGVPICDLTCGLYAALSTVSALRARDNSGTGQHLDLSLYESGVSFAIWEAGRYFATGEVATPHGTAHQNSAPYQAVRTVDGWCTIGAVSPATWKGLCDALDLPELYADERYQTAYARYTRRETLIPAIEEATKARTTADIIAALQERGVPCAPISNYAEVFEDEHLGAREFFWDADHPQAGRTRQLGSPMRLSETPARRASAGPVLGADTTAILQAHGYDEHALERLRGEGVIGTS